MVPCREMGNDFRPRVAVLAITLLQLHPCPNPSQLNLTQVRANNFHKMTIGKLLFQGFSPLGRLPTWSEVQTPQSLLLRGFLSLKKGTKCAGKNCDGTFWDVGASVCATDVKWMCNTLCSEIVAVQSWR